MKLSEMTASECCDRLRKLGFTYSAEERGGDWMQTWCDCSRDIYFYSHRGESGFAQRVLTTVEGWMTGVAPKWLSEWDE